jgi:hypothetical protein
MTCERLRFQVAKGLSAKRLAPKEQRPHLRKKRLHPITSITYIEPLRPTQTLESYTLTQSPAMGILDFISEITSAFSVTPVDADAPQADEQTSGSENQDEGEDKGVDSKEENPEDGGEDESSEEEQEEEEEEEEEEPEDTKPKLEEGKSNPLILRLGGLCFGTQNTVIV